jgi:hypothetical protein
MATEIEVRDRAAVDVASHRRSSFHGIRRSEAFWSVRWPGLFGSCPKMMGAFRLSRFIGEFFAVWGSSSVS